MFKSAEKMCRHMYTNRLMQLVLFVDLGLVQATAAENRTSLAIFNTAVISDPFNTTVIRNETGFRDNDEITLNVSDADLTNDESHLQHGGLTQSSASNSTSRTADSFYIPTDENSTASIPETATGQANAATSTTSAIHVPNSVVPPGIRNRQSKVFPTNAGDIFTTKAHKDVTTDQMSKEICDGFACGEDEFCSRQWRRCRACEDIKSRCQDIGDVHSNVPACEAFCIRLQTEEADRVCTAEKLVYQQEINQLYQSLTETDTALNKTRREANADHDRCTGEQEESGQKLTDQDNLIKELDNNLTEAREEAAKYRQELNVNEEKSDRLERELTVFRVTTGLLGLLLLGAAVAVALLVKSRRALKKRWTNTSEHRRLIQRPVPVEPTTVADQRNGINLGFGDKLLPGGARSPICLQRRDVIVPA